MITCLLLLAMIVLVLSFALMVGLTHVLESFIASICRYVRGSRVQGRLTRREWLAENKARRKTRKRLRRQRWFVGKNFLVWIACLRGICRLACVSLQLILIKVLLEIGIALVLVATMYLYFLFVRCVLCFTLTWLRRKRRSSYPLHGRTYRGGAGVGDVHEDNLSGLC